MINIKNVTIETQRKIGQAYIKKLNKIIAIRACYFVSSVNSDNDVLLVNEAVRTRDNVCHLSRSQAEFTVSSRAVITLLMILLFNRPVVYTVNGPIVCLIEVYLLNNPSLQSALQTQHQFIQNFRFVVLHA
jgi:hypothetical protein